MDARYKSRKFLVTLGTIVGAMVFFGMGKMTAQEYIGYTQFVLASYLALNVGQKAVEKARTP